MNWLEFVANVLSTIASVAWPVVVAISVLLLKDKLGSVLDAIAKKFSGATSVTGPGNFSIKFAEEVTRAKESAEKLEIDDREPARGEEAQETPPANQPGRKPSPSTAETSSNNTASYNLLNKLEELWAYSPRAAILEAYLLVEFEAAKVLHFYSPSEAGTRYKGAPLRALRAIRDVPREVLMNVDRLARLRNEAAHEPDFSADIETVREYGKAALAVAHSLNGLLAVDDSEALFAELDAGLPKKSQ